MTLASLTHFTVRNLHGTRTFSIPIKDNRLVLIGVNGLGKSTVITLLYLVLTRQWRRLSEYEFSELILTINGEEISVRREDIGPYLRLRNMFTSKVYRYALPSSFRSIDLDQAAEWDLLASIPHLSASEMRTVSSELRIPTTVLQSIGRELNLEPDLLSHTRTNPLQALNDQLAETVKSHVLFLPTYRRIEKDLETIVPELKDEIKRFNERAAQREPRVGQGFLELVQFGMEDVERSVRLTLSGLKDTARTELHNLTGTYLRDVIRDQANKYDPKSIIALDEDTIERISNRVEERTLDTKDKRDLKSAIGRIKQQSSKSTNDNDRYIAHFFTQLAKLDSTIADKEKSIIRFVDTCNKYLVEKRLIYNDARYELHVVDATTSEKRDIELSMLSSGEKQIVSLFAHLYLSDIADFLVIIDEPELSLSVDWQNQFLPDIVDTGKVSFLGAVTHSPFVFENKLDPYAVDLRRCIVQ